MQRPETHSETLSAPAADLLKEATSSAHEDVDRASGAVIRRENGGQDFLRVTARVVVPYERMLRQLSWPASLQVAQRMQRESWLTADLGELENTPIMPLCETNVGWGALYVLEGSSLGGRVLRRAFPDLASSRYLAAHGEETPAMWLAFKQSLNAAVTTRDALDAAVEGARDVFQHFLAELQQHA